MGASLDKLTIKGFKSIRELKDFELTHLNVIIGGNGAGKSNLISFFRMPRALVDGNLNRYVKENGGPIPPGPMQSERPIPGFSEDETRGPLPV